MKGNRIVVGVFTYLDDALKVIRHAKKEGLDYRVYSPVPHHELEEETMPEKSPVRFFTFLGAVSGLIGGFYLATWTSLDYPLRVSAKAIPSIPGFIVIGFECTILFGGLATLAGLCTMCRIPDFIKRIGFDPRFTCDKFGVVLGADEKTEQEIKKVFEDCGADEINVRTGL